LVQAGSSSSDQDEESRLRVKEAHIEPDTLLYTWGCAADGKLGISDTYYADFENDLLNRFYSQDDLEDASGDVLHDDLPPGVSLVEAQDLIEFESKYVFTPKPQPVVRLMGEKASTIVCGKSHVLMLTSEGQLYTWGSNGRGQLGLSRKDTEKRVEWTSYQTEESGDAAADKNPSLGLAGSANQPRIGGATGAGSTSGYGLLAGDD